MTSDEGISTNQIGNANPADVLMRFAAPARQGVGDDTPDEYVILRNHGTFQGFLLYGRYGDRWLANCSERGAIRHLIGKLAATEKRASWAELLAKYAHHFGFPEHPVDDVGLPIETPELRAALEAALAAGGE